jgi:thymidylate synthase
MFHPFLSAPTFDDLMRKVITSINEYGEQTTPTKGSARELFGVLLELTNPLKRLSLTETRGKPYSCLGELCWYLSGSNRLDVISYYIPRYKEYADGEIVFGGYGPRLLNWEGTSQLRTVTALLERKKDSRQAVIQIFDRNDIVGKHGDVPCTCSFQFMLRSGKLNMLTNMRSNDAFLGLPHDFFCFTMLQEIVARSLSAEVGTYKHVVGSLHLYDENSELAEQFIDEGWQSTEVTMPPMPIGDPWQSIEMLLKAEEAIRTSQTFDEGILARLDPYWADLIRLLKVFACKQKGQKNRIKAIQAEMASKAYFHFIERTIAQMP